MPGISKKKEEKVKKGEKNKFCSWYTKYAIT
jgi:hypothetical protein